MEEKTGESKKQQYQRWTPELDVILSGGYKNGRTGATASISEVERRTGRSRASIWKRASRNEVASKSRPWATADKECALELSTEKPVGVIARSLRRTRHSIQCKLSKLKRTTKSFEGYTRTSLAEQLHLNRAGIRWFMDERWLKALPDRLPRLDRGDLTLDPNTASLPVPKAERNQNLRYQRISEESLRGLLRKHPEEIPYWRLDSDTLEWLGRLGFKPKDNPKLRQLSKHVDHIHQCKWCGRKTPGNGHFRHVRHCARNPENIRPSKGRS